MRNESNPISEDTIMTDERLDDLWIDLGGEG